MSENKPASIADVRKAVGVEGETLKQFGEEWKKLTPQDKEDLKQGVGDGTLNY